MAAVSINWGDLAKVAEVSLAFSIGIVVVFALGVLGLSRVEAVRTGRSGSATGGYALAGACFAACAAAAAYGIWLIVPQFH